MSQDKKLSDIEFELKKLGLRYKELFETHPFTYEFDRWTELVKSLVITQSNKPEAIVSDLIEELETLDLLELNSLSDLLSQGGKIDFKHPLCERIVSIMMEYDFSEHEAKEALITISEAAAGLVKNYAGKIQKYIRHYAELILKEIPHNFTFSKLKEEKAEYAFVYWIQNTLNMPISLRDENVDKLCREFDCSLEEFEEAADKTDLNHALLDDIALQNLQDQKKS